MTATIETEAPSETPRRGLRVTRRHLIYLLGAVSGFVWLLPVFGPPGSGPSSTDTSSFIRYLRIIMPLCVFLLVRPQNVIYLRHILRIKMSQGRLPRFTLRLLGLVLALGFVPLFAGLLSANFLFVISAVLPLTVSLISLVGIVLLDERDFREWVVGITGAATVMLIFGMVISHFEPTTYYGRPRILLGFVHPIHTASVILAAMAFGLLTRFDWVQHPSPRLRRFLLSCYGGAGLLLMVLAQSRNILLSLCVGSFCAWVGGKTRFAGRFLIFLTLLFLPVSLYLFVLTGSERNPIWAAVNVLSSYRLGVLQSVLAQTVDLSDPKQLFEPSSARLTALSDYVGFASTDSVFQTFFFNYGLIALLSFFALLFVLGRKLSMKRTDIYPFGAICGIVLFFSLDAQGITTSNLILFTTFAYAVRAAVTPPFLRGID